MAKIRKADGTELNIADLSDEQVNSYIGRNKRKINELSSKGKLSDSENEDYYRYIEELSNLHKQKTGTLGSDMTDTTDDADWGDLDDTTEDDTDSTAEEDADWGDLDDTTEDDTDPSAEEDFSHIKSVKEANKEIKNETDKQTRLQATLDTARSNLNALNSLAATQADLDIHQQELSDEQDHLKKLQEIHSRNRLWKRALIGVVTLGFYGKKQRDKDRDYLSGLPGNVTMWDVRSIIKDSKAKIKTEQNEIDRLATLKNEKVEAVKQLGFNGPFDNADEIGVMKQEAQLKVDNAQNALTKSAARILGLEQSKQEVQPSMMRRALKAAALPLAAVLGVGAYYLNSSMGGLPDLGQADVLQSATDFVQYAWHGIGGPNAMAHVTSLAESYGIDLSSFGNNTETTDIPDGYIDPALSQAAEEAKIAAAEQAVLDDRLAQAAADEAAQQVAQAPATLPDLDATAGNDLAAADVQAVENDGQLQGTQEPTTNVAATETAQNNLIDGKTPSELVGEGLAAAEVLKAEALGEAVQGHIDTAQAAADAAAQQVAQAPATLPDLDTTAGNDLAAADVQAVENDGQLQGTQEPTTNVAATETAQNNLIDGKTPSELVGEGLAAAEVLKAEALGEAVQGHIDTAQAVADATAQQANQLAAAPDITTDAPQPPADLEIANTDVGSIPNNVEPVQPASVDTLPPAMAATDSLMTVSQENPVQNIFDPSGIVDGDNVSGHNDIEVVYDWLNLAESAGVDTNLIQSLDEKFHTPHDFVMTADSVDVMNAYCGSLQEAFNNDGVIMTSEYKDALTEGLTALIDAEVVTNVSGQWDDTKLYSQESFDAATQCMNQFTNSANAVVAEAEGVSESLRPKARPGAAPVLNS